MSRRIVAESSPADTSGGGVVLDASGLQVAFGQTQALRGARLRVGNGEIIAVTGPSGSGKSTLLHVAAGILRPDAGSVQFEGEEISRSGERGRSDIRLRRMGLVFQFGDLVPELTLAENVALPLRLIGQPRRAAQAAAQQMLRELDVAEVGDRVAAQVSGGQSQRAAVARALVHQPPIVFADEPTGALDLAAGELVLEALVGAAKQRGAAVVLVTHEARVAAYADRDITMVDGRTDAAALALA